MIVDPATVVERPAGRGGEPPHLHGPAGQRAEQRHPHGCARLFAGRDRRHHGRHHSRGESRPASRPRAPSRDRAASRTTVLCPCWRSRSARVSPPMSTASTPATSMRSATCSPTKCGSSSWPDADERQARGGTYFTNYASMQDWQFVPGLVDRRPALHRARPARSVGQADLFVLLEWAGARSPRSATSATRATRSKTRR